MAYHTTPVYDVVIVGAGLSGINMAYRLQTEVPAVSYTILESQPSLGGTWRLFRYPGIRSDSSLWTFGFPWHPWTEESGIASGASILLYLETCARETGIDQKIQFGQKLLSASWSSDAQSWTLRTQAADEDPVLHARFLVLCTGYYDYERPLPAVIPGIETFAGPVVHPQFWPDDDFDLAGKRVVVVGSGATAVTLVPALTKTCSHVTMLQRSPSYIASSEAVDPLRQTLQKYLPAWLTYKIMRWRSLVVGTLFLKYCAAFPTRARALLEKATVKQLPPHVPHDPHFRPLYSPWEQRLCLSPDGDFYHALREGKATIVTGAIKRVTEWHVELCSGQTIDADVIITATGLKLQVGGGAQLYVDNEPMKLSDKYIWKGTMMQDLPNVGLAFGYANASWTLGADCAAWLICRVLKYMSRSAFTSATPRLDARLALVDAPVLPLTSTYVVEGKQDLPKAGMQAPWLPRTSYLWDFWDSKFGSIASGMEYRSIST